MNNQDVLDPVHGRVPQEPKNNFLRGILYTLIYYALGLGLAALSYAIVGHTYIHAPGLHHWIIFLTFAGGFAWTLGALVKYVSGTRTKKLKGILLTNAVAVITFVLMIYTILYAEREVITATDDEISMQQRGDTTIFSQNDNIVYMKVGDSVLLNFIDSARFAQIVDSTGITVEK